MIIRNGKAQYSNKNKILSRTISSTVNGYSVLDLQINNNILTDLSGNVIQWNNNAKGYENIGFLPNTIDYGSNGLDNPKIVNGGVQSSFPYNSFMYFDDINTNYLTFTLNDSFVISAEIRAKDISEWADSRYHYLYAHGNISNDTSITDRNNIIFIFRKYSSTKFLILFRIYDSSNNSNYGTAIVSSSILSPDNDHIISMVYENKNICLLIDDILISKESVNIGSISNTYKYITVLCKGNYTNNKIAMTFATLKRVVVQKNTFFDIANKSVGNTIYTGFYKKINI